MKKMMLVLMLSLVSCLCLADQKIKDQMQADLMEAKNIFKSNLIKNENFAQLLVSMTHDIVDDFNDMVDDVWYFFCKMHTYCVENLRQNPLFEKYKQFMQKKSIIGTVSCSLEDKKSRNYTKLLKRADEDELAEALQPFCETLSKDERKEFNEMMHKFCAFFKNLRVEYEEMLDSYASVEKSLNELLKDSPKTICIECGMEYPFPTFVYYLD